MSGTQIAETPKDDAEKEALQLLDEASKALKDIKNESQSEAEIKALSERIEASLPKSQAEDKVVSRLSIAEKKLPPPPNLSNVKEPPPAPVPHLDQVGRAVTSAESTSIATTAVSSTSSTTSQEQVRRKWSFKRIFHRKKK